MIEKIQPESFFGLMWEGERDPDERTGCINFVFWRDGQKHNVDLQIHFEDKDPELKIDRDRVRIAAYTDSGEQLGGFEIPIDELEPWPEGDDKDESSAAGGHRDAASGRDEKPQAAS